MGWIAVSLLLVIMPPLRERAAGAAWSGWGYGLLAATFNLAGSLLLLRAFSVGRAAMIAPLVTSYAAVTALLEFATGHPLSGFRLLGVIVCLIGAPLAAARSGAGQPLRNAGVAHAIGSAVCLGVGFWLQGAFAAPLLGAAPTFWLLFGLAGLLLVLWLVIDGERILPPRTALPLLLTQSFCSLAGYGSFAVGMATGFVTVVTVLSTFAAAVTALLGFSLRRERLTLTQWLGVSAVLVGAILLHSGA